MITLPLLPGQHEAWVKAAAAEDRSLSYWIRSCCDDAAKYTPPAKPIRKKRRKTSRKAT